MAGEMDFSNVGVESIKYEAVYSPSISSLLRKLPTQLTNPKFDNSISPAMAGRWSQKCAGAPAKGSANRSSSKF